MLPVPFAIMLPESQAVAHGHSRDFRRIEQLREVFHKEPTFWFPYTLFGHRLYTICTGVYCLFPVLRSTQRR